MKALLIILPCWAALSVPVCLFAAAFIRAGNRKKIDSRE